MKSLRTSLLTVGILGMFYSGAVNAQPVGEAADVIYPVVIVGGTEGAKRTQESYLGVYAALNGNLDRDGIILRALGSFGGFHYGTAPNKFDGDLWQGDVMVGYQWVRNSFEFSVLVGADFQRYKITPDDLDNRVRGSEAGFKTVLDLESTGGATARHYFAARGSYSTAFDSYYALGRIGMNVGHGLFFGPEVWALGDKGGDATRVGGFLLLDAPLSPTTVGQISLSVGYQFAEDDKNRRFAEEGVYGTLKFRMALGRSAPSTYGAPLK